MTAIRTLFLASLIVGSAFAAFGGLRADVKPHEAPADIAAQVSGLHAKLEKMSAGLSAMVGPKGTLGGSKISTTLNAFVTQLHTVLDETKGSKDAKALKRLQDAQAGVRSLVGDMTRQQERLMKEGDDQEQSLLLGVLMTKQSKPMNEQMEVLSSEEFSHLACVKAILAGKDRTTPLFKQVATFLDQHSGSKPASVAAAPVEGTAAALPEKLKVGKNGKPDVSPIVDALSFRLKHMEESLTHMEHVHKEEMKQLKAAEMKVAAKNNTKGVKHVQRMEKKEERQFDKQQAVARNDAKSLKGAIQAVQTGDMKALAKSQAALEASMKAMQAQTGGFLYLIQLGHRSEGLDCPYCAAQCVDKCHTAGKSYVTCLTDCADAGK